MGAGIDTGGARSRVRPVGLGAREAMKGCAMSWDPTHGARELRVLGDEDAPSLPEVVDGFDDEDEEDDAFLVDDDEDDDDFFDEDDDDLDEDYDDDDEDEDDDDL